jgi:hypothetical protein
MMHDSPPLHGRKRRLIAVAHSDDGAGIGSGQYDSVPSVSRTSGKDVTTVMTPFESSSEAYTRNPSDFLPFSVRMNAFSAEGRSIQSDGGVVFKGVRWS